MATQVQLRRGTSTQNDSFTGAQGELTFDTTNKRVRIHDGATTGGFELKTENAGGDTLFADNEKAIFGAGSDLQIYHSGTTSYISDVGDGDLLIQGSNAVRLTNTSGANYFKGTDGAQVQLYYGGATKLTTTSTGIDVTGTVNADSLTVTGSTGSVATVRLQAEELHADIVSVNEGVNYGGVKIKTNSNGTLKDRLKIESNGDISFYEDTGTTAKFFWDASAGQLQLSGTDGAQLRMYANAGGGSYWDMYSVYGSSNPDLKFSNSVNGDLVTFAASGNVGIGTSSPSRLLTVSPSTGSAQIALVSQDSSLSEVLFGDAADDNVGRVYYDHASNYMSLWTNASEAMRIDSSGQVGIGTSSPSATLEVNGYGKFTSSDNSPRLHITGGRDYMLTTTAGGLFGLYDNTASSYRLAVDTSGNVGIGTASPSRKVHIDGGSTDAAIQFTNTSTGSTGADGTYVGHSGTGNDFQLFNYETGYMRFGTNNAERMRIDSTGQVGIGTSSPSDRLHVSGASSVFKQQNNVTSWTLGLDAADQSYKIKHNGTERMRIDSSGNVLVGKTTIGIANVGGELRADGQITGTKDGGAPLALNRKTSDGDIALFQKNGGTVGSIASGDSGNEFKWYGAFASGAGLGAYSNVSIRPLSNTGAASDNAVNLGHSSQRFKDLYLSGGVYLGGTGSANKLDDYEEGNFTPTLGATSANPSVGYSTQSGYYIKVGGLVTVWIAITLSSISGGSGNVCINGMPFTLRNDTAMLANQGGMIDQITSDSRQISFQGDPGSTRFLLISGGGSTGGHGGMGSAEFQTSTDIRVCLQYSTAL